MNNKQTLVTIFGILLGAAFVIFIILSIVNFFTNPQKPSGVTPTPTRTTDSPNTQRPSGSPLNSLLIPTTASMGRIDTTSLSIQGSTQELSKIEPFLNYQKEIILPNGNFIDIVISKRGLQETPWILPVSISGIKFQLPINDPNYSQEQQSFREASKELFEWLESHDVDVKKIYIRWGDKAYIQQRAEEWLNN